MKTACFRFVTLVHANEILANEWIDYRDDMIGKSYHQLNLQYNDKGRNYWDIIIGWWVMFNLSHQPTVDKRWNRYWLMVMLHVYLIKVQSNDIHEWLK